MKMKIIRGILIGLVLAVLPMSATAMGDSRYVNSIDGLRIREKPTIHSQTLDVLPFGSEVFLADDEDYGGWYMVWHGEETAYVCKQFVQETDPLEDLTYMGNWRITAYAYTGSACANENYPSVGYTIACNSLPFGTEVYIKGVGFRTVEDRGPTWMSDEWCDLYLENTTECIQWGDQYLDVYVVEEGK